MASKAPKCRFCGQQHFGNCAPRSNIPSTVGDSRLAQLEAIIERGRRAFMEMGAALTEIKDKRLYRENHATFEAYCEERWGFSASRGYRIIEGFAAAKVLPIGNSPTNEGQAREVAKIARDLGSEAAAEVMQKVGPKATAKAIRAAAQPELTPSSYIETPCQHLNVRCTDCGATVNGRLA